MMTTLIAITTKLVMAAAINKSSDADDDDSDNDQDNGNDSDNDSDNDSNSDNNNACSPGNGTVM